MQLSTLVEKLDTQTAVSGYMTYAGCVNAGDQVLFRSHLEKQDTGYLGAASSESDPCVRKTGCCLWTGW